jgi:gliding motility-associated-like protein
MNYKVLLFLFCLFTHSNEVAAQNLEWANALVGQGESNIENLTEGASECFGLVVDDNKYVYITGICNDSVDFDPGPNTSYVVAGKNDIYLAKYSPEGNLVWKVVLISQSMNIVNGIKLDASGNILIIGSIQGDVDFDPSSATELVQVPFGMANKMFIAKYDANGSFLWVKAVGGTFATKCSDLETDENGEIYVTGSYYQSLDIDPSGNENMLTSTGLALYFSKYTENGDLLWARNIPNCTNLGEATDIDLSAAGNIYISGFFGNTLDFDGGAGIYNLVATTATDRYFAKYTNEGEFIWANSIDVNAEFALEADRSIEMALDEQENLFITGNFKGNVDFDPGGAVFQLPAPAYHSSTYICKYDANGLFLWAKMITNGFCVANDIELDCAGNINLTGFFKQADFDPGPGTYLLQSSAPVAFMNFFAQYDDQGNFNWVKRIGNNGYGSGIIQSGIHVKNGSQYIFGAFKQSGDFDPDDNKEYWLTMGGVGWNSYFAKYSGDWANTYTELQICDADTAVLVATVAASNYLWQDGSTDSLFLAFESGEYFVTSTAGKCTKKDVFSVNMIACGASIISMPNVFTPNGDGVNDVYLPIETYNLKNYSIQILNRWGVVVFEGKNKNTGWDGTSAGKNCTEGTYFWIVRYTDDQFIDHQINGFLNLTR